MINLRHLSLELWQMDAKQIERFITLIKDVNPWTLHYFRIQAEAQVTTLAITKCSPGALSHLDIDNYAGYLAAEKHQNQIKKLGISNYEMTLPGDLLERIAQNFSHVEQLVVLQIDRRLPLTAEQLMDWYGDLIYRLGNAQPHLEQIAITFRPRRMALGARTENGWVIRFKKDTYPKHDYFPEYTWARPPPDMWN
ncbi:hypothetical protein G7Z17_g8509 [Cylindrodendrum hubeiense]|uniref:Uncharacterized protein n=1 Tax=Cylindrodendrum hubeiense TaxID=595255 RepID=A0A9P5H5T4_9HYPO|nr:hypothetical protein G7Z17_g8509 [Cylindrodendrum hubeiense]